MTQYKLIGFIILTTILFVVAGVLFKYSKTKGKEGQEATWNAMIVGTAIIFLVSAIAVLTVLVILPTLGINIPQGHINSQTGPDHKGADWSETINKTITTSGSSNGNVVKPKSPSWTV